MDLWVTFLLGGIACLLAYIFQKRDSRLAPGPWPVLPIVGHIPWFFPDSLQGGVNIRKKYGDITTTKLGSVWNITLHSPKLMREAFNNPAIAGRPDLPFLTAAVEGKNGILASDGHDWIEQRRFSLRNLRDFGFGKQSMENLIQETISEFVSELKKDLGKPVNLQEWFSIVVIGALWRIVAGEKVSLRDEKLRQLLQKLNEAFRQTEVSLGSFFIPWLPKVFPGLTNFEKFLKASTAPYAYLETLIVKHKQDFQDDDPKDFIENYLQEMKRNENNVNSSFHGAKGEKHLRGIVGDLFSAGSETTSITLTWIILYALKHEKVKAKLCNEIQHVLGDSKPSLTDRAKMPYTEAVIAETMRFSSIVPFGVMHSCMEDTYVNGYFIPKGYTVSAFHYGIHHDERFWGDPENFRPERFLTEDGKFQKHEALIPFSVGKRQCLGELLARDELFLLTTSLFQTFEITLDPEYKNASLKPRQGALLSPEPFKVILKEKN